MARAKQTQAGNSISDSEMFCASVGTWVCASARNILDTKTYKDAFDVSRAMMLKLFFVPNEFLLLNKTGSSVLAKHSYAVLNVFALGVSANIILPVREPHLFTPLTNAACVGRNPQWLGSKGSN